MEVNLSAVMKTRPNIYARFIMTIPITILVLMLSAHLLDATIPGWLRWSTATQKQYELFDQACDVAVEFSEEDEFMELSFHSLYRSHNDSTLGLRTKVHMTYVLNNRTNNCGGRFYSSGDLQQTNLTFIKMFLHEPFELPEGISNAENMEVPILVDSYFGSTYLFEFPDQIIKHRAE